MEKVVFVHLKDGLVDDIETNDPTLRAYYINWDLIDDTAQDWPRHQYPVSLTHVSTLTEREQEEHYSDDGLVRAYKWVDKDGNPAMHQSLATAMAEAKAAVRPFDQPVLHPVLLRDGVVVQVDPPVSP